MLFGTFTCVLCKWVTDFGVDTKVEVGIFLKLKPMANV